MRMSRFEKWPRRCFRGLSDVRSDRASSPSGYAVRAPSHCHVPTLASTGPLHCAGAADEAPRAAGPCIPGKAPHAALCDPGALRARRELPVLGRALDAAADGQYVSPGASHARRPLTPAQSSPRTPRTQYRCRRRYASARRNSRRCVTPPADRARTHTRRARPWPLPQTHQVRAPWLRSPGQH